LVLQAAENIFLDLSEAFLMFKKSISERLSQNTLQTGKKIGQKLYLLKNDCFKPQIKEQYPCGYHKHFSSFFGN